MQVKRMLIKMIVSRSFGVVALLVLVVVWAALDNAARAMTAQDLVDAAVARTEHAVTYDGSYRRIAYPMGDVPQQFGVCTDVVIRAYRAYGVDLQRRVHEDMKTGFVDYPGHWGLKAPDPNIDHRRVPNLQVFFERHGQSLSITRSPDDYLPGDLVTWTVGGSRPHIGIVTNRMSADGRRPKIVHNIGRGPRLEDMLFDFPITGHYRYLPASPAS